MEHKSQVNYVLKSNDGERILFTMPTLKVPEVGEVIGIEDVVNTIWQEKRFSNEPWFNEEHKREAFLRKTEHSMRGDYEVISIKRYIQGYECVNSIEGLEMPGVRYVETFEVFLTAKTEE